MKRHPVLTRAVLAGGIVTVSALVVWLWNMRPALAVGASQNEKICICTGQLDDSGEVTWILDSLTGDLKAFTMHQSGKYSASYHRNIMTEFGLDRSKATPQFTMVTGQERFARRGPIAPIASVLHVAEATSGRMVAYTLALNPALRTKYVDPTKPGAIIALDGVQFRGDIRRSPVTE